MMAVRIGATVVSGFGATSGNKGTIARQKPHLEKYLPEIVNCFDGTINLLLDIPLQIGLPDIVTLPLKWHPDDPNYDERFGLTAIQLERKGNHFQAWIYTAEKTPHRCKSGMIEVLAQRLDGVVPGERCAIHVPRLERANLALI